MSKTDEVVMRGVEFLDERAPYWRDRVQPETLHLASCRQCVLGQVFGDFDTGLDRLGLDYGEAEDLGFAADNSGTYGWLTRAWRKVLR